MKRDDLMDLPPGFRFHPTDEELITHYLMKKVSDRSFSSIAIGEVDMNRVEPWDLPWRAKLGEKEWYFFCLRDKKYPTGLRTNRATAAGYWKATGKDKEIFRGIALVGMKKTLVFYKGRAPKGEKTDWVCHEYRLVGKFSHDQSSKNDWVISRVFHKTSGGKKVHISELIRMDSNGEEIGPPTLLQLPLVDAKSSELVSGHVHCFSNNIEDDLITCFNNPIIPPSSSSMDDGILQFTPPQAGFGFKLPGPVTYPEPSITRTFSLTNYGQDMNEGFIEQKDMTSVSQETVLSTENSSVVSNVEMGKKTFQEQRGMVDPQDLDCIWSY